MDTQLANQLGNQLGSQLLNQLIAIMEFVAAQFAGTWPYLLITIPLAVAVKLSGASRFITRALSAQPLVAIVLATAVGAFSPFCSCSVIPVVASLLIGGVPLAPVMAFWIASPSMDPEIFFLSVSTLGWELSLWRLGSTLALSLAGGFITYFLMRRGWLGTNILRTNTRRARPLTAGVQGAWHNFSGWLSTAFTLAPRPAIAVAAVTPAPSVPTAPACGCTGSDCRSDGHAEPQTGSAISCSASESILVSPAEAAPGCSTACSAGKPAGAQPSFGQRLLAETWDATLMVVKFMLLAYTLEALISVYVPQDWIVATLGGDQPFVIALAALLGVPIYTSNLAAMPLIGGLLAQGMSPAAALTFLIAGPTTTLPAMAAVSGLVTRRVFLLYVGFALFGALIAGYVYALAHYLW